MNDTKKLKAMKVQFQELNYLEEFKDAEIDSKISPLICACSLGRIDCVKLLLENDLIDVNLASDKCGFTPLGVACATANYEIMCLIIDHGADINKKTSYKQPPLVYCFTRLQEDTNIFENQLLCMKMAEKLLENGADINVPIDDEKGYTLLMQFCSIKIELTELEKDLNLKVVAFLLEHGAEKEVKSKKGKTAYMLAEKHCNKDKVRETLSKTKRKYKYPTNMPKEPTEPKKKSFSRWFQAENYQITAGCCSFFK